MKSICLLYIAFHILRNLIPANCLQCNSVIRMHALLINCSLNLSRHICECICCGLLSKEV